MKKIFINADVVTMDEALPSAEAVVIEDGKIVFVGTSSEALAMSADGEVVDLEGKALLPGFIDPHSHFSGMAFSFIQAGLGEAASFDDIKNKILEHISSNKLPKGEWINCTGYDHNSLEEKAHPTAQWLDEFCGDYKVVLQHKSGHMGVFNSAALEFAGITPDTPCPDGGKIGVDADGKLNGYLEEGIYVSTITNLPMPDPKEIFGGFIKGQYKYAAYGITTIQEGMFVPQLAPMYQPLVANNMLKLDVVTYLDFRAVEELKAMFPECVGQYHNNFKIGGIKMILDGSPQGRTAWMETPYAGADDGYCGYPYMPDEAVTGVLKQGGALGLQVLAHCNGDAAAAQYLRCMDAAAEEVPAVDKTRNVMIHCQLLRPDQMDGLVKHNMVASFFVAHVYHWGDVHMKNFGAERAAMISSVKSAIGKGIRYTFHQDTPVLQPNMLETLWIVTNRITKNGVVLGEKEKISTYEALKGITINAAYQYGEEDSKGSITAGKMADIVILDRNPLKVDTMELKNLVVCETLKRGETLFKLA